MRFRLALSLLSLALFAAPAAAQLEVDITGGIAQPMPIAVPGMPTPAVANTPAGDTAALGQRVADVVTNDLKNSGLFSPLPKSALQTVTHPQVTAPDYMFWTQSGAQALIQGFVQANGDGSLTVGCYLYDVLARTELTRQGGEPMPPLVNALAQGQGLDILPTQYNILAAKNAAADLQGIGRQV